jgi:hypothetical protein
MLMLCCIVEMASKNCAIFLSLQTYLLMVLKYLSSLKLWPTSSQRHLTFLKQIIMTCFIFCIRWEDHIKLTLISLIHLMPLFFLHMLSILYRCTEMNALSAVKGHTREIVPYSSTTLCKSLPTSITNCRGGGTSAIPTLSTVYDTNC